MLKKRSLLLAKTEVTYGTDPTPAAANDAILVSNLNVKVNGEVLTRDFDRASLSNLEHTIGKRDVEITFTTELKSSGTADNGTAGDAPEIDPLLKACGFARTLTAGPAGDIAYDPVSAGFDSVTLWPYLDGVIHKANGCRGTFSVDLQNGRYGVINWTFKGLYADPVDGVIASGAVFNATKPSPFMGASFSLQSYAAIIQQFQLAVGNDIQMRESANAADGILGIEIVDRDISGSFNPEAVTEATHDFWAKWKAGTAGALTMTIGSAVGARIDITAPKVQYKEIGWSDRAGQRVYDVPLNFAQSSGDDELQIKFY